METIRKILSDRDIKVKKDKKRIKMLLDEEEDITRPKDEIRRNDMGVFEYSYLMIAIVGKSEALLRYVIINDFTDPVLSQEDIERIKELKEAAL